MANKLDSKISQTYHQEWEVLVMRPACNAEFCTLLYHLLVAQDYELWVGDVQAEGLLSFRELSNLFANYNSGLCWVVEKGRIPAHLRLHVADESIVVALVGQQVLTSHLNHMLWCHAAHHEAILELKHPIGCKVMNIHITMDPACIPSSF